MADNLTPATRVERLLNNPGSLTAATRLEKFIQRSGSGGSGGMSNAVKAALLDCFDNVAWANDDGQQYYDALEDALYPVTPPAEVVSISAVYTQTGTVYYTDSLDSLESDLVVTATYEDETTAVVTHYTLSGTLAAGTSTITVTYEEKTTTFTVTVSSGYKLQSMFSSTGSEYIDTGVHLPQNGTVTIAEEFVITQFQTTGGSDIDYIFGTRQSASDNSYIALQSNHKTSGSNLGKYLWGAGIGWSSGLNIIDVNQVVRIVHVITVSDGGLAYSISANFKNVTAGTSQTFTNNYTATTAISTNSFKIGNLFNSTGFIGTLNDFVIDDYEWTADEISAFLAS